MAVAGTVIDIISAEDRPGQFLHEIVLLVGAFGGGDERERVRTSSAFDFRHPPGDQIEGFVPGSFAKFAVLPYEWLGETVGTIHVVPAKFPLDAGGDPVRWTFGRFDLKDFAVLGPKVESAADAAIALSIGT